ncbi:hypothetical protein AVEN_155827-1 [Araneus ventricosus]|uniref:Uncharacterized protein n=1 Tax=Araneus ventricosus TaxID=182803 RepID=A0A4Y2JVC1_ARAVE|nr:hypothetical protein AVEN_155827-1 [Araneus ventricosus]
MPVSSGALGTNELLTLVEFYPFLTVQDKEEQLGCVKIHVTFRKSYVGMPAYVQPDVSSETPTSKTAVPECRKDSKPVITISGIKVRLVEPYQSSKLRPPY